MFHEESSLRHHANRNRIDALLSDKTVEPMAFASEESKALLEKRPGASVKWNTTTGTPSWIEGKLSMPMVGSAVGVSQSFLMENPAALGLSSEDAEELTEIDSFEWSGLQFIRLQQNHQGLPVFGASVLVGIDEKNQVRMVTSGLRPEISVKRSEKTISLKQARQIAKKDLGEAFELRGHITHKTVLYPTQNSQNYVIKI